MSYDFDKYPRQISAKFKITKELGHGAYGTVFNAIDKKTHKRMAIKKVEDVFSTTTDARRALREIAIMRLCRHPNIVIMSDVYALPDDSTFQHLWVVMEYGGYDLGKIIKHSRSLHGWSSLHVRFIAWQILAGLHYLHSGNIAHRDLKPSNILVTEDNHVSLIDFGLARQLRAMDDEAPDEDSEDHDSAKTKPHMIRKLTQHVVTRWYRPPELILMQSQYTAAVDVWSFGCIFAELLLTLDKSKRSRPLFPGRTSFPLSKERTKRQNLAVELSKSTHQLSQIFAVIGSPSVTEIEAIARADIRAALEARPKEEPSKPLDTTFRKSHKRAVALLKNTLKFDPDKRVTVAQMLVDPWFQDVMDQKKMFKASNKMTFPFEEIPRLPDRMQEKERLRKLICAEIVDIRRSGIVEAAEEAPEDESMKQ